MQRIVPNLWFDNSAKAAVDRYTDIFDDASVGETTHYDEATAKVSGMSEGSLMTVEFELEGQTFVALNGGPHFSFNPSVSFIVNCQITEVVDELWDALSKGGSELMPLGTYPFSDRHGWLTDEFGVSWQIVYADYIAERRIVPSLHRSDAGDEETRPRCAKTGGARLTQTGTRSSHATSVVQFGTSQRI